MVASIERHRRKVNAMWTEEIIIDEATGELVVLQATTLEELDRMADALLDERLLPA